MDELDAANKRNVLEPSAWVDQHGDYLYREEEGDQLTAAFFDKRGNWRPEFHSTLCQPLDSLEREEFWSILRDCLDALPTRQADVFALREMDDRSTEDSETKLPDESRERIKASDQIKAVLIRIIHQPLGAKHLVGNKSA